METYIEELQKIAIQIIRSLAMCLDIDTSLIMELFEEEKAYQTMRMTYYPPCPQPELVVGLTPHSDAAAITILHQINCVNGLEIKRSGSWFPVNILPDAFVVNVGDTMEVYKIKYMFWVSTSCSQIPFLLF